MRLAVFFERAVQAMHESREREALRVLGQHAHFLAQADEYERNRAQKAASTKAGAQAIADAKSVMARAGLQFAPRNMP